MQVPIQSIQIVAAATDDDLAFVAAFAANEIACVSGVRPTVVSSTVSEMPYTLCVARREGLGDDTYTLISDDTSLTISSSSRRGLLFGIGRFLRLSPAGDGCLDIPLGLDREWTPTSRIRGHQIGYGHLSNSMDSWSVAQFDRYIRDLILFGCNAIEIEYKPDPSPHHKLSFDEMATELSVMAVRYDLDCTLWIPNWGDEPHYHEALTSGQELEDRERFFRLLPRISGITVPGGDPGSLRPHVLFPWVERLTEALGASGHTPEAWVSAQWMKADTGWYDSFTEHANERPDWLAGIVHGPWTQLSIPELRRRLRGNLPIRRYTDLTHGIFCQYPVRDWDLAHAMTSGREPINPRPTAYKHIHNLYHRDTVGSTPHTTGINADLNTIVWLDQEWDPDTDVCDTLREYSRLFLSSGLEEGFAEGVFALEQNWEGSLAENDGVDETLDLWQQLEQSADEDVAGRWRFQCPLLRAHYDASVRLRLVREIRVACRARDGLVSDRSCDSIQRAIAMLDGMTPDSDEADLRERCEALSEGLHASIGLKSSVEGHGVAQKGRGAFMDAIDEPLNDALWLTGQLEKGLAAGSDAERSSMVGSLLGRTHPGPGGIYDNLGVPGQIGRLVNAVDFEKDPGGLEGSRAAFGIALEGMPRSQTVEIKDHDGEPIPMAWLTCVEAIYDTPLILRYDGLEDGWAYTLRVVYPSRIGKKARLVANDDFVVHELIATGDEAVKSFGIPAGVVREGRLQLAWTGGGERGVQVAELWIGRVTSDH